ncbi:MAG: hypothetical protein LAT64_02370 [Phycisphaerales bacterium]|nr:hypothetical protein [Planctomycetota bacterium]MCH8507603.1 hypothetical protein [Phycisphaerales bacterium]
MKRIALGALLAVAGGAHAATIDFVAVSNNSGISSQINTSVQVSQDLLNNTVSFTLSNSSSGVITSFYIESGSALSGLSNATILNSPPDVNFNNSTGHPGQGNPGGAVGSWAGPSFFAMQAAPPPTSTGLNYNESVTVIFDRDANFDFSGLTAAIQSAEIRMAIHYQSFGPGNDSEWLVTVIPLPPAGWAGLGTLALIAGVRGVRRRGRA